MLTDPVMTARSLRPQVEAFGATAEDERRLGKEVVSLLNDAGLFGLSLPKAFGGQDCDLVTLHETSEELAFADSAVGWVHQIYLFSNYMAAFLPKKWAEEFISKQSKAGHPIFAGAAAPMGVAEPVEGGLRVSGRWSWGSGIHHADAVLAGARINHPNGKTDIRFLVLDRDDVEIIDNWHTSGLCGTGSCDFAVSEAFVPEGRWISPGPTMRPAAPHRLANYPHTCFAASSIAVVPIAIARRALSDFTELASGRTLLHASGRMAQDPIIQKTFGDAEARISAARHYFYGALSVAAKALEQDTPPSAEEARQVRLASAHAVRECRDAVQMLYTAAGGAALRRDCSLQKHLRDVNAATAHLMVRDDNFRLMGAARLTG